MVGVKYSRVIDLLSSPSKVKEKTGIWLVLPGVISGADQVGEHTVAGQRLILTGLPCCDTKKRKPDGSEFTQARRREQALASRQTFLQNNRVEIINATGWREWRYFFPYAGFMKKRAAGSGT